MDLKKKVTISWSGGKDSALALFKILRSGEFHVVNLHCVINAESKRVGMHGVREELIEEQARQIGLPLEKLYLESSESHAAYSGLMEDFYQQCARKGIQRVVFGDIFLEDLKKFRENLLANSGLTGFFPLWKRDTGSLIQEFVHAGFKTLLCAADASHFSSKDVGGVIDEIFIRNLSPTIDPCGENGEFHTFVFAGPIFKKQIPFERGDLVRKSYAFNRTDEAGNVHTQESAFWFQDLLPRIAR